MRTIQISISENDFMNYAFNSHKLSFSELENRIRKKTIRDALYKCHEIAGKEGLSKMTLEDINREILSVRENDAKNNP